MRKHKLWAGLAGLALLVTMALADNNVLNHGTYYSNAPTGLKADGASGNLATAEQFPAMDANLTFASIISNAALGIGDGDSSAILDTHRMRLGMLLFKPMSGTGNAGSADTTTSYRIAFQIRTHLNGQADSSSTFAIYQYGVAPANVATAQAADTSSQGQVYDSATLTAVLPTVVSIMPWSGEYSLVFSGQRFAYANSIAVNGNTFYYPNGVAISLQSLFGREIYSPYTSVRVRVLTIQKGSVTQSTNGKLGLTVSLIGTPL